MNYCMGGKFFSGPAEVIVPSRYKWHNKMFVPKQGPGQKVSRHQMFALKQGAGGKVFA